MGPSSKKKDHMFPSISFNQTFPINWLLSFTNICKPGLSWMGFHQGHKEVTGLRLRWFLHCRCAASDLLPILSLPQLQVLLGFLLIFQSFYSSLSVSTDLPFAYHPHQHLATCHVLFSNICVFLASVDSQAWYIAVLTPNISCGLWWPEPVSSPNPVGCGPTATHTLTRVEANNRPCLEAKSPLPVLILL